ncbi:MAG: hypothetical protein ABSA67_13685 [Candidatus Brocadiia bacterium]|jgi:hypothetical protein
MATSEKRRAAFAYLLVLVSGVVAGALVSAFLGFAELHPAAPVHFRDLAWRYISLDRFARYGIGLTVAFTLIWGLTNYYIHRRTGAPLSGLLLWDGIRFLAGAPLIAALVAFGPISGRPRFLNDVGLLYLVLLAWKLYPFLKAALFSRASVRRRDVWIAVLAIGLGFFLLDHPRPLDGDEPHYLVYADSLMRDRDADLRNSYDSRITGRFANGLTPDGQTVVVTNPETGKSFLRPYHYPGLPVLILPGYAAAGACGAKIVVLLLTAAGLTGLFVLLRNIGVNAAVAARGVAFLACTSPFITYGLQIYPEMAAAAGLVWGMVLLTDERFEGGAALAVGALAAALPWLHIRYAPLSAALLLIALVRCRFSAGKLPSLILPVLASAAALLGFYHAVYGAFSPAPISALPDRFSFWASLSWRRSVTYLCALFLDSQGGVIAYAPALLLAPMGAALLYRRDRRLMAVLMLPVALETVLIAAGWRSWHGDWSPPSRFMACVCPLLGALAIVAYERCLGNAWLRRLCHALLAVGALLGALMIADPEAMYNMHQAWSIPAISQSYPLIPIGWFFPNYADLGARTVALTAVWIAAIAALTCYCMFTTMTRNSTTTTRRARRTLHDEH